jgi:hypothetical protein
MSAFVTRLALVLLVACGGATPAPQPQPDPQPQPQPADPVLSDDGHHVRVDRVYEGQCMPAGTRGGCHTITLKADGTYENFLFDAMIRGTYEIQDHVVTLSGQGTDTPEQLTLSDDFGMLGDLPYKP